jgi:hypothetical protein
MEHWDARVVYDLAIARHREDIARGEAAQRRAEALGARPARARLAAALLALAARLDPVGALAAPEGRPLAGVPPA